MSVGARERTAAPLVELVLAHAAALVVSRTAALTAALTSRARQPPLPRRLQRGHPDAHHLATFLWKEAVDWALGEWKVGRSPGTLDFRQHLTDLPRADWPLHAHSTEAAAHDLHESIATFRTSKRNGMDVRPPWREKSFGRRRSPVATAGTSPPRGCSPSRCEGASPDPPSRCPRSPTPKPRRRSRLPAGERSSRDGTATPGARACTSWYCPPRETLSWGTTRRRSARGSSTRRRWARESSTPQRSTGGSPTRWGSPCATMPPTSTCS